MKSQTAKIKEQFVKGLKEYLLQENEQALANAYEQGRYYLQEGIGELEIIRLYHNAIAEIQEEIGEGDAEQKIEKASTYLTEWLAPYDMRQRGYEEIVSRLHKKNEQLEKEIERRKETEKELVESKQYFQSLIKNAQDIITVLNHDATIRYQSPAIERVLGYHPKELRGEFIFDYTHPDESEALKKIFYEGIQEPGYTTTVQYRFKHKNGEWRYLESVAKNLMEDMDTPVVIVNSRDVTERIRATKKLQEKSIQLEEAQRIARVGSWEWEVGKEDGLRWSDEMCRIYGIDPEEFERSYDVFLDHIHPEDLEEVEQTVKKAMERKESFSFEHRIVRADGEIRYLFGRGNIITDDEGEVIKMVGTGQDVTERKQTEQQLRNYSEKLKNLSAKQEKVREEERTRIARELHDELGQMLTVLKMDISLANEEIKEVDDGHLFNEVENDLEDVMKRVDTIVESVQRITTQLRPEVLDDLGLLEAIEWQAREYEKRGKWEIDFCTNIEVLEIPLVEERSTAIFRIFQETLTNILRHANASKVNIRLNITDENLILEVEDDGKGISKKEINDKGSLGIIGMRERSNFLGGTIKFEGEPGEGTMVTLQIPLEHDSGNSYVKEEENISLED